MVLFRNIRTKTQNKLSYSLQVRFLKYFHRLLSNGYSVIEALETIGWDNHLHLPAKVIRDSLKSGYPIDRAFEKAKFHPTVTSLLYFLKVNGDLVGNVEKCLYTLQQQISYSKKLQQVIRYPLLLIFIFVILLISIRRYVLPSFTDILQSNSTTIYRSFLIIDVFSSIFISLFFLSIVCVIAWLHLKDKLPIKDQIKIYRRIPLYRSILRIETSYFFAIHFGSLLQTGMATKEIIYLLTEQRKHPILSHFATVITEELTRGLRLDYIVSQLPFLDKQLVAIFRNNTDNYSLGKDLTIYSELLVEEIEGNVSKWITYVQPIFFTILASFIIFIYINLLWPMFQLIQTL